MLVNVLHAGRRSHAIELTARKPVVETAEGFEFDLDGSVRGVITDHRSSSLRAPSAENPLELVPRHRYLVCMHTSGALAADARLSARLIQYSADARLAETRATVEHDAARLVTSIDPAMRGTAIVLRVTGSGCVRVDAIRAYPLDTALAEIERWVDAAAADQDALDLVTLVRQRKRRRVEDERFHLLRIGEKLRAHLAAMRPRSAHPARLDAGAARLAMLGGDFTAARELWLQVIDTGPEHEDAAIRALADCDLKLGDFDSAYRRLVEIRDRFVGDKRFAAQLERARLKLERATRERRITSILKRRSLLERSSSLAAFYVANGIEHRQAQLVARLWSEFQDAAAALLLDTRHRPAVYGSASARKSRTDDADSAPADITSADHAANSAADLDTLRAVTTTGFFYSGSGAVNDWLLEFDNVEMPLGPTESSVIGSLGDRPGAASLLRAQVSARRRLANAARQLVTDRNVDAALREVALAVSPRRARAELYRALEAVVLRTVLADDAHGLLRHACSDAESFDAFSDAFERFIAELRALDPKAPQLGGRLVAPVARLLLRTAAAKAEDDRRLLLLNNLVRGVDFPLLRWIPHLRSITVLRDPRDQFAAQCIESSEPLTVHQFVPILNYVRRNYAVWMRDPSVAERVVEVQFERFVTSEDYRAEVAAAFELDPSAASRGSHFQPDVSARNVGIHRVFPDQAAIRAIEKACEPWLFDAAESR